MDTKTGDLFKFPNMVEALNRELTQVPTEHQKEASEILGDLGYAKVDMSSKTSGLVKWANDVEASKRKKDNRRRKIAKNSRRRNRGK